MRICQRCAMEVPVGDVRCPGCGFTAFVATPAPEPLAVPAPAAAPAPRRGLPPDARRWLIAAGALLITPPVCGLLSSGLTSLIAPRAEGGWSLFLAALAVLAAVIADHGGAVFWAAAVACAVTAYARDRADLRRRRGG